MKMFKKMCLLGLMLLMLASVGCAGFGKALGKEFTVSKIGDFKSLGVSIDGAVVNITQDSQNEGAAQVVYRDGIALFGETNAGINKSASQIVHTKAEMGTIMAGITGLVGGVGLEAAGCPLGPATPVVTMAAMILANSHDKTVSAAKRAQNVKDTKEVLDKQIKIQEQQLESLKLQNQMLNK
jgi:uncharacterized membrane protein YeaQ/YmgE (transglycosylase-associated protein family)